MEHPPTIAAIDLGSNSFRLEIGFFRGSEFVRQHYIKRTLRQGACLENGCLSAAAMQAGWACLAEFGQLLHQHQVQHARAVATQTLREARNSADFVREGSRLLGGLPIDIISGEQEAALIYRGVASQLPPSTDRRLIVDLGGRSTEITLGQGLQAQQLASYPLGSVLWTGRFFGDGVLSEAAFAQAEAAASTVLAQATTLFPIGSWDCAYASAGTATAVSDVLAAHGHGASPITRAEVYWLRAQLLRCGHIGQLALPGLRADKAPVVAGGLSVLLALFHTLQLQAMVPAQGALRIGVLHSLCTPTG